jgi:hypothetical protein
MFHECAVEFIVDFLISPRIIDLGGGQRLGKLLGPLARDAFKR